MSKKEFWKDWKRVTKLEKEAIKSIKKAKKILLENISKEKIVAIYIKGSFPRREMNEKSDVDIVPIVKDNKLLKEIIKLDKENRHLYKPSELLPSSLWEFKHNKIYLKSKDPKGRPDGFIRDLDKHKLIFGKPLNPQEFTIRNDKEKLKGMINAFKEIFLPFYKEKKFGFSEIVKQVFWLTENEQKVKGKNPPHSWKELTKSIKDKNHIIHQAYEFRLKPAKDKKQRQEFIKKLKTHLKNLEKLTV